MSTHCARAYHRSMRIQRIALALVAFTFLVLAPAAVAAGKSTTYAPPGKAGSSEYSEVVPASGGNVAPPSNGGGNTNAAQISALGSGKAGVDKLSKLGKAGAAAAVFAQATAPVASTHGLGSPTSGGATTGSTGTPGHHVSVLASSSGGSGASAIGQLLDGSDAGGIGVFLPLLLAFGLGAAVTVSVQRARRGRQPPA
jgi:hypothetical protein